jgi:yersiniabactin nonribosomal peptide synthetase
MTGTMHEPALTADAKPVGARPAKADEMLDLAAFTGAIAQQLELDRDSIGPEDDLLELGLDSIGVMRFAARCRAAGFDLTFADLIEWRTPGEWWSLAQDRRAGDRGGLVTSALPATRPPARESDAEEAFDLAPMQRAYRIGRAGSHAMGGVGSHFYCELDGAGVDPSRLERAIGFLEQRHPMLRAQFLPDGRQRIMPSMTSRVLVVHDFRDSPPGELECVLLRLRDDLSHRRLDVEDGQVFDVQLSLLPDGQCRTHIQIEMLVADARSFRVLLTDLAQIYASDGDLQPVPAITFREYLDAKARQPEGPDSDRAYWHDRIPHLPAAPALPLAADPRQVTAHRMVRRFHMLTSDQCQHLVNKARSYKLTLPAVFATAFAEVVAAWSEEQHFLLNLPLYDRASLHRDIDGVVGDFTSLLLLEVRPASRSFLEDATQLQQQMRTDMAHSSYSGIEVLRDLARSHPDWVTVAPVVFTSAIGLGELFSDEVRTRLGQPAWNMSQTPQVWLDHQVTERDGGLYLNWDVVEELFPPAVLDAMFSAYVRKLRWLMKADWRRPPPDHVPYAQRLARAKANDTAGPVSGRTLHGPVFNSARRSSQIAVYHAGAPISYAELADSALRLAALLRARGLQAGDRVAVTLPRGPGQVRAVLGILAAGGAYVPVGIDQPAVRRAKIHRAAGIQLAVTDTEHHACVRWPSGTEVIEMEAAAGAAPMPRPISVDPHAVAYVLFTSGSTGEPKGVMVSHANAVNTIDAINDRYQVSPADRTIAVSNLDFDLSVYDLFGMFAVGGATVLVGEADRRNAKHWAQLVRDTGVTIWQSVPLLLEMVLTAAAAEGQGLPTLRLALLGGDWVRSELPGMLAAQAAGARCVALGGTTETAIHSTVYDGELGNGWQTVPYGYPLRNQRCRVVDGYGHDRPDWVPGELWIGGGSVAVGYAAEPDRTAQQFVSLGGIRWYRTGDRARYRPGGMLEFLGRTDNQVKVRGHRIELGEIQAALSTHPAVSRALAFIVGAPTISIAAAVTVTAGHARPRPDQLRAYAEQALPDYMVPSVIVVQDALPMSANGKVDVKALQSLAVAGRVVPHRTPPASEVERTVAELWQQLLEVGEVCREDGFFALGGDSLLATRLMARLREAGFTGAGLIEIFATPGLAEFAALLRPGVPPPASPLRADPDHRHEPFPATDVQRAYWIGRTSDMVLGGVGSHWYWEFDGEDADVDALTRAVNQLVARHEMLRAVFDDDGRQRILPFAPQYTVQVSQGEQAVRDLRADLSARIPDPHTWPLFEIRAVRYGAGRCRLGFSLDYIVIDAMSIVTFFAELGALYRDPDAVLAPVGVSFRDYVINGGPDPAAVAQARDYWRKRATEMPRAPQLPLACEPSELGPPRFVRRAHTLAADQWGRLKDRCRRHDITPSAALAAAYAEVLSRWSGQPDLTLNLTLFDRREVHPDIRNVMGDFTSLLLVDHHSGAPGWLELVRHFQETMWSGMAHAAVSAIHVMREMALSQGHQQVGMPVVFTSALGLPRRLTDFSFPFGEQVWGVSQTPQTWLDNQVMERDGALVINWDAVEDLFPAGLLDAMQAGYLALLDWMSRADWSEPVPDLRPASQREVRALVNSPTGSTGRPQLHSEFFRLAEQQPAAVALLKDGLRVTYGELSGMALQIATLLQNQGVRPGDSVAISVRRGFWQIAAVLGVLAAGACYIPIAKSQPARRRDMILRNSGTSLVLTDDPGRDWPSGMTRLAVDDALGLTAPPNGPVFVGPRDLAYVIYTSGSTGEPKGVEITHQSAMNTVAAINDRWRVGPGDRGLAISALDFDLSVYDIIGLLSAGGSLVLLDEGEQREADRLRQAVVEHRVTVWNSVPALLDMLLVANDGRPMPSLRIALLSGDWVGLDLPARLAAAAPDAVFVALGGATEAAIWSNAIEVAAVLPAWRSIPYGTPLRNQRFRVVDQLGRDCPDHVPGELWIGGLGVARGYRHDDERTAQRFVRIDGDRWYRTGDMGRYGPDGTLEFLGRADFQVKIGGHRIELGEIEQALAGAPLVRQAVAVTVGAERAPRLALAVVPAEPSSFDLRQVRTWLSERLPGYMMPGVIGVLPELPLSANGKVDRLAVSRTLARPADAELDAPADQWEERVTEIWGELLGQSGIGCDVSFFALGGDSLLATRLTTLVRQRYHVELPLRELFSRPTVRQTADWLRAQVSADESDESDEVEEGVL